MIEIIVFVYVAVICMLVYWYYRKLWQAMEQPQKQTRQPKTFQFVDETETESEDLSPEHTLISDDEEEETETIFYL